MQCDYPELRQWAFDTLSIPAMSAELERIFSQAKRTITSDRNRLLAESFEESQCLKHWLDHGLFSLVARCPIKDLFLQPWSRLLGVAPRLLRSGTRTRTTGSRILPTLLWWRHSYG